MQKPILKFNHFSGLFEEDESSGNSAQIKAIDIIINTFFEMYGMIVTRIGGYREGVKDYQAIANSENEKRGELMVSTIEKISRLVEQKKPELKGVLGEYKKSMDLLRQAYDKILVEDKGQLINIKKKIKDMIITYLEKLISDVKTTKVPEEEKKNESFDFIGELLLEKDLYQKERAKIIKSIVPLKTKTSDLASKSIFPEIKAIASKSLKKYDSIIKTLQDDKFFDTKTRAKRAEEIENSRINIITTENELNKALSEVSIKYGIKKEINELIKKSLSSLTSANEELQRIEIKKAQEEEIQKVESSESDSKKVEDPKKIMGSYESKDIKDLEDKKVYYKKEDWDDDKKISDQKNQIAIGKVVKGSVDEVKKEFKIYNEDSKKTFTKSTSDLIDKKEGNENSPKKIGEEKKEGTEKKEYKEIKEGDKDPESIKEVQKKINSILPEEFKVKESGQYAKDTKESLVKAIRMMKAIGVLDPDYPEKSEKITPDLQKSMDEYIKQIEEIRKNIPKS
jgi:hypothetical protein